MGTEKEMGIRFRFKTAGTQRIYTVLKIVLKLVFIEMTKLKTQASTLEYFRPIEYIKNIIPNLNLLNIL